MTDCYLYGVLFEGQGDGEGGALAELAGEGDMSFVQGNDLGNIVEADAESFHVVYVAGRDTIEFLEDMLLILFGDADTVVGDFQDGLVALGASGDDDVRSLFGVLDGVVD